MPVSRRVPLLSVSLSVSVSLCGAYLEARLSGLFSLVQQLKVGQSLSLAALRAHHASHLPPPTLIRATSL